MILAGVLLLAVLLFLALRTSVRPDAVSVAATRRSSTASSSDRNVPEERHDAEKSLPPVGKSAADPMRIVHGSFVDNVFMPAAAAFHLSHDKSAKLKELLIQREGAKSDTIAIAHSSPPGKVLVPNAIVRSLTEIDNEIVDLIGPENTDKARGMLEAEADLGRIANNYGVSFTKSGYPLSPEQRLSLAIVLHESFSPEANPAAKNRATLPIDEVTGLTVLDRGALDRLATVLSPPQLLHMQKSFVETNNVRVAIQKNNK